jgi:bifunctional DNA-binding transcriptional regulator/antitoxin component of YhaV-PrlF toxin-antitoxin module
MSDTITLQLAQRGVLTLPKALRESYNLQPGDSFTLLDLGGVFVLSPRRSEIDALADRLTQSLTQQGETLETMLQALREERERYAGQD